LVNHEVGYAAWGDSQHFKHKQKTNKKS